MIIGVTGTIGSGKSTFCEMLIKEFGDREIPIVMIDSDKIARQAFNRRYINQMIRDNFGDNIIEDGEISRSAVAEIIFNDDEKREQLNNIMHPYIIHKQRQMIYDIQKENEDTVIILNSPLLIETSNHKFVDTVLVVIPGDEQINLIMKRDDTRYEMAMKQIESQLSDDEKIEHADFVIYNDESLDALQDQAKLYCDVYRRNHGIEDPILVIRPKVGETWIQIIPGKPDFGVPQVEYHMFIHTDYNFDNESLHFTHCDGSGCHIDHNDDDFDHTKCIPSDMIHGQNGYSRVQPPVEED